MYKCNLSILTCHTAYEIFKDTLHNELSMQDLLKKYYSFIADFILNIMLIFEPVF